MADGVHATSWAGEPGRSRPEQHVRDTHENTAGDLLVVIQFISQFVAIGGLVYLVLALLEQRKFSAVNAARAVAVSELADREPGQGIRCAVQGAAEPGSAGLLTAPLSGQPCVWFLITVREKWRTVEKDEGREVSTRHDKLRRTVDSPPQFCVRDATGLAVVNFAGTAVDEPEQSYVRTLSATESPDPELPAVQVKADRAKRDHTITWREVIVPPGRTVYVVGKGSRHLETGHVVMGKPDRGPFIVSTLPGAEFRERTVQRMKSRYLRGVSLFVVGAAVFAAIEVLVNPTS
ncbi:GIDE domain-containing protein [Streptomyces sp. NPDC003860]